MSKKPRKTTAKFEFTGFINIDFSAAEKSAIGNWLDTFQDDALDAIVVLVEAMYKVGVSYSDFHEAYTFTATCKNAASPYYGKCFTYVHADMHRGLLVLRYLYDSMWKDGNYVEEEKADRYNW